MSMTTRRSLIGSASTALLFLSPSMSVRAQGPLKLVRFAVEFSWEGNHGIYTLAQDLGYFAAQNLDVNIDRGYGAGNNMTKLAAGSLDIAVVDPNLLPKFNHEQPATQLISFFIVYDASPSAVIYLKSSGIQSPKDLEGKRIAVTEGTTPAILFPVFAKVNGVDPSRVSILAVNAQLRDSMVVQKSADASIGFLTTSIPNIVSTGVAISDIGYLQYNKYGLELYSLGLVCRKSYAEENPEVLRGFVKAVIKGVRTMLSSPEQAIASVKKRDGLLNDKVELVRMKLMNEMSLLTPHVRQNGMSTIDRERFERSVGQVASASGVSLSPKMEDIYTAKLLPPKEDRMIN
jgi:NitT/TauT family transport system substrate-binding protein